MKYEEILAAFQHASGFDLYRLHAMLDRVLDDPKWIEPVRRQLQVGQKITFFDARTNKEHDATVVEFQRKGVVVCLARLPVPLIVPYTAINIDGVDVKIREPDAMGLSRHEVAVGETVGFLDHDHQQRQGQIIRLNDKTVTLRRMIWPWRC